MFVLRFKAKNRGKALRYSLIAALIIFLVIFAVVKNSGAKADTATCDELGEYSVAALTEEQQLDVLRSFGIENAELTESDEITIPEEFNSLTEKYNELQKKIGLDLSPYKGQKAERLIFKYSPGGSGEGYAVLLINDGRLIGGHLTSRVYGDEVRPLTDGKNGTT